ncbi:amino acid permease [Teratosphaeria destructans]|uniref:Amino acid permease n=1 Tax=Teratosphaeria destructans TaxID=418781 RepID=A0A9W7SYD6_9PEZI|nr:amino acid permease [Teratosphaeria destructans]
MEKNDHAVVTASHASIRKEDGVSVDADELRLAQMGHKQELDRHFNTLSLIGLASTTTISWTGLGLGLTTDIGAGGPGAVIYGFVLVAVLQAFLGASLAEFVSAYPTEGGMYHWIAAVAPRRYMGFLSFMTGFFTVFGWIFTTASTNLIYAEVIMALVALYHPGMTIQTWQTFVAYEGLNVVTALVVLYGNKKIPILNKFSLFYLQIGWFVVMVTVVACAPKHQSNDFVFRTWINETGWQNQVICFITGLVNPLYSLGGLDGVTHITEEMPNPSRNAPLAIAITLIIAFVTGFTYLIALMFSVQDWTALSNSNIGLPLTELFYQVTSSAGGAFGLTFMLFIALGPCVVGSQLSTGRVFWAFSRDGAMPLSKIWSKIHPTLHIPFNSQLAVTAIMAALGCLYLGSSTAFNSLMGTAVTINNLAYLVPILTNLLRGRKHMHRGTFFMSGGVGHAVNMITVAWLVFAIVFFSFPYYIPVTAANMNYTCLVVGGLAWLQIAWFCWTGREYSQRMLKAKET